MGTLNSSILRFHLYNELLTPSLPLPTLLHILVFSRKLPLEHRFSNPIILHFQCGQTNSEHFHQSFQFSNSCIHHSYPYIQETSEVILLHSLNSWFFLFSPYNYLIKFKTLKQAQMVPHAVPLHIQAHNFSPTLYFSLTFCSIYIWFIQQKSK